jgi:predicted RNase H-like HicB family nuclease
MTAPNFSYTAVFTADPLGGYTAEVPILPGCISEGQTLSEAKDNIKEAIELYLESLMADFTVRAAVM